MFGILKNNILHYGTSLIGLSHVKKGSVCQDASKAKKLVNGWVVAAVADGVGSAKHSEIASNLAVDTVVEFCNNRINKHTIFNDLQNIILDAYKEAEKNIENYASSHEDSIIEYDTTLSMIIYDGEKIAYGHSGDGGIVGLTMDGEYIKITEPQKAEDNICVIPLRAGEKSWVIGKYTLPLASVLLATDGVYDTFFPYLLKGQEPEIYVPLVRFFMDNNYIRISDSNIDDIKKSKIEFLQSPAYDSVTDDKTLLVVFNSKAFPALKEESYYLEPDWDRLQLEWNRKAYPHLYNQPAEDNKDEEENANSEEKQ